MFRHSYKYGMAFFLWSNLIEIKSTIFQMTAKIWLSISNSYDLKYIVVIKISLLRFVFAGVGVYSHLFYIYIYIYNLYEWICVHVRKKILGYKYA